VNGTDTFTIATMDRPELIVTNLALEAFNGFELVQHLKNEPATAFIPVLGITGRPYPELEHDARRAGLDALLIMPVTAATLGEVAGLLIARAALLRERSRRPLQNGAALRARSATIQREAAASSTVQATGAAALPTSPKCRRCGSDADNRLVRTTQSSTTYWCGMCNTQWRCTYRKRSLAPTT
jgi:PleD family two-component response regulator